MKGKNIMFFKSLIKTLHAINAFNDKGYDNVDPNIIKYFKNEYGTNWRVALEHHLCKESIKNDKKAA